MSAMDYPWRGTVQSMTRVARLPSYRERPMVMVVIEVDDQDGNIGTRKGSLTVVMPTLDAPLPDTRVSIQIKTEPA